MDVLIVGAGSMGTWFARTIDARVTFVDVDHDAAADGAARVDGQTTELDGTDTYDVVCIAVPMSRVEGAIAEHAPRGERAIVDVAGVMDGPLEAMARHAPDLEHLSLHPLFAPERAPGSIPVVRGRTGPVTDDILADLEAAGNEIVETTAEEHDEAMETVQAVTHAAILSFALAASEVPEGFETPVYERLCDLADIVLEGNARVYADIQRTFDGADALADAATRIAETEGAGLDDLYREASIRWESLSESTVAEQVGSTEAGEDVSRDDVPGGDRP